MIITGCAHSGRLLGAYLLKDKNERVEEWGIRGDIPRDLEETLNDWSSDYLGTHCSKPLYHAQLSPDRILSSVEWDKAIELFEKAMGFEKQPRVLVLHENKGRQHLHLVYSRIDENGHAISDSWTYVNHEKASREIERELGMEKIQGVFIDRNGMRPERTPSRTAIQQAELLKINLQKTHTNVRQLYQSADNGRAFAAALESEGFKLAQGNLGAYVVIDKLRGIHSLLRIVGVNADQLRSTLRDLNLQNLPNVQAARQVQQKQLQTFTIENQVSNKELYPNIQIENQTGRPITLTERLRRTQQERLNSRKLAGHDKAVILGYELNIKLQL